MRYLAADILGVNSIVYPSTTLEGTEDVRHVLDGTGWHCIHPAKFWLVTFYLICTISLKFGIDKQLLGDVSLGALRIDVEELERLPCKKLVST